MGSVNMSAGGWEPERDTQNVWAGECGLETGSVHVSAGGLERERDTRNVGGGGWGDT